MEDVTSQGRPLVTFALFAYNQERYIREAIEGAFSQTYEPLEIILSDDCSTDRTFEIMQEMASHYRGPHRIILNRTPENLCTLGHFFNVVDRSSGRIIVLAAGDDVSKPERSAKTVAELGGDFYGAIHAGCELIDDDGGLILKNYFPASLSKLASKVFKRDRVYDVHGATSAYCLDFVKTLPRPEGRFYFEDSFMSFMIYLYGGNIKLINESLVSYRTHRKSLSNGFFGKKSYGQEVEVQKSASLYALNKYQLYKSLLDILADTSQLASIGDKEFVELEDYVESFLVIGKWYEFSLFVKIKKLYKYKKDAFFVRWGMPRIFGVYVFAFLKSVFRKV